MRSSGGNQLLKRTVHALVYYNLRLFQRVSAEGLEHLPRSGSAMLVSNHPSYLDPAAIYIMTLPARRVHFMAWDRLFALPAVGWICDNFDAFPVNLERADRDAYRRAARLLQRGEIVGIFPEGQRARADGFHPTKRGGVRLAIRHRVPIVPCTILGARRCWPVERALPRAGKVRIRLSPPIAPPAPAESPEARITQELELLARLHRLINEELRAAGEIERVPPYAWSSNGR